MKKIIEISSVILIALGAPLVAAPEKCEYSTGSAAVTHLKSLESQSSAKSTEMAKASFDITDTTKALLAAAQEYGAARKSYLDHHDQEADATAGGQATYDAWAAEDKRLLGVCGEEKTNDGKWKVVNDLLLKLGRTSADGKNDHTKVIAQVEKALLRLEPASARTAAVTELTNAFEVDCGKGKKMKQMFVEGQQGGLLEAREKAQGEYQKLQEEIFAFRQRCADVVAFDLARENEELKAQIAELERLAAIAAAQGYRQSPTGDPTPVPTPVPSTTAVPTAQPTVVPTAQPTAVATATPVPSPTEDPQANLPGAGTTPDPTPTTTPVPGGTTPVPSATAQATPDPTPAGDNLRTIASGDTLGEIATEFAATLPPPPPAIWGADGLVALLFKHLEGKRDNSTPDLIFPGQTIDLEAVKADLAS